ncbi:hypothetical protein GCM10007866_20290 [Gluconobacter albidus]|uniref:Transposase InsH N-terminal domain-containing protein n=1 Tax=Gluconobacter albidus TaxID=318683 RepID=A0ABQ5X193_9PROT|nr:hypothetical protein GCM10007866_20290 [Gluconobacter albidus]
MFKILVIQTLNNLSDERTEYLINDHLSFMRFLGLRLSDRVPDAKTVWLFRERLTQAGAIDVLFNRFDATLRNAGDVPPFLYPLKRRVPVFYGLGLVG